MNNESKIRCEHIAQNWHCKNAAGEIFSFGTVITGQLNLETNEILISDHLEIARNSEVDEISEFAIQNIHEIMSKKLEEQIRE